MIDAPLPVLISGTIFLCVLAWHLMENRLLRKHLKIENAEDKWLYRLMRMAWSRTVQTSLALSAIVVVLYAYEDKLSLLRISDAHMQQAYSECSTALQEAQKRISDQEATLDQNLEKRSADTDPNSIGSVFINDANGEEKKKSEEIKRRYEELLVSYMYLKKCAMSKPEDFHIIRSALAREMASINAPGRLQHDILTAAQGSYKEIYVRTPCSQEGVSALRDNFRKYIDSILAHSE